MNNTYQIYSFELFLKKSITFWFEGTTLPFMILMKNEKKIIFTYPLSCLSEGFGTVITLEGLPI